MSTRRMACWKSVCLLDRKPRLCRQSFDGRAISNTNVFLLPLSNVAGQFGTLGGRHRDGAGIQANLSLLEHIGLQTSRLAAAEQA